MKPLKPVLALSKEGNNFLLDVSFTVETGIDLDNNPKPRYGRLIDDPKDGYVGQRETLIDIALAGTKRPGLRVMTFQFLLLGEKIQRKNDIRVRVHTKHDDEDHDGTSGSHYGDPDRP